MRGCEVQSRKGRQLRPTSVADAARPVDEIRSCCCCFFLHIRHIPPKPYMHIVICNSIEMKLTHDFLDVLLAEKVSVGTRHGEAKS